MTVCAEFAATNKAMNILCTLTLTKMESPSFLGGVATQVRSNLTPTLISND
jgi:hypothetical protein